MWIMFICISSILVGRQWIASKDLLLAKQKKSATVSLSKMMIYELVTEPQVMFHKSSCAFEPPGYKPTGREEQKL